MVKTTHTSFPQEGIDVHISASDALAHGVSPGDPAVVEAIVRPFTPEERTAEGIERNTQSADEEVELSGPMPEPDPAAEPVGSRDADGRIRWKSARRPAATPEPAAAVAPEPAAAVAPEPAAAVAPEPAAAVAPEPAAATPEPAAAVAAEPAGSAAAEGHTRIRWKSERRAAAPPDPVAVPANPNGSASADDHTRIRWRSARLRG